MKKANSLSLSARKLNELAKKPEYTITDDSSGGFNFSGCSYHELKYYGVLSNSLRHQQFLLDNLLMFFVLTIN